MQCFTGNCTTYEECRDLSLIADCPDDQAYDACLTYVDQKAHGKLTIVKKCGLRPCTLSELDWWGDECDRKRDDDSYTCTSCCSQTLCNTGVRRSGFILLNLGIISHIELSIVVFTIHALLSNVYFLSAKLNQ